MTKIVAGAALIAGAVALTIATGGIGAVALVAESGEMGALFGGELAVAGVVGADLLMSGIADALHLNNTGQSAFASHQPYKPWQIVYGRQRVSGITIDMSLSDGGNHDNRWLWQVQVLAAHPVKSILATYLNQQQVFCDTSRGLSGTNGLTGNLIGSVAASGGNMDVNGMALEIHPFDLNFHEYDNFYWDGNPRFWMAQYNGLQTAADPFYMALCNQTGGAGTPHWTSECVVKNMAYSLNRYWANSNWATGAPQARYDVEGKNDIYDPRTSSSGYSENAALVLADYMCNQQYGMLYDIADFDADTLIAAANICDETVALTNSQIIFNATHSTEARYTINGTLSTSTGGGSVIEQMLGAMAGRISYIGGSWYIFPGAYQGTSGVALTETDLMGGIKWSPNRKARDLFNEVRALFTCPSGWDTTLASGFDVYNVTAETVEDYFNGQWARIDMPPFCFNSLRDYSSDPYLTADNSVKYIQQVDFPYTISVAAAQRLAKIMLLRNRWQGTGTLTLPINFLSIQPNDIITLTYARFGWTNKQLEVQGTRINTGDVDDNGNFTAPSLSVTVAEVDSSIYNWESSDELKLQGGQSVAGTSIYTLPAPTNLILASSDATAQVTASGLYVPSILATWTSPSEAWITNGGKIVVQIAAGGSTAYQTVAVLDGSTTGYNIIGVSDGVSYEVNVYGITMQGAISASVTGSVTVAGGATATLGYGFLANPIRTAIFEDGTVQNVGGTAAATVLAGVENASTALTNAATAQAAANAANTLLTTISTTAILTPGQKPAIIADYNALIAAQSANDAQAVLVGVSHSAYDTALSALTTYLGTLTSPVAWNVLTNYTTINGTTFASDFEAAYAAETALLNAIAGAINSTAGTGVENAATAQAAAVAAQAAANTANTLLTTISTTAILTPGQKPAIIADYNALIAAQSANDAQAVLVGVSHSAYDTALSTLTAYLGTLTSPAAWNVLTNYTTINGTTFASDFETAYAAETALLNAIAGAINSTAGTGVENAATAQAAAVAAQTAANAANTLLTTISTTAILTPGQKPAIIADYNALIAAQSANDAQAVLVGVSHSAYDTALSALTTYLGTLTSPVAWNVLTNYTTINGTTFANDFEAAYAAETALLNAIAGAINTVSTLANSAVILQNPNFITGSFSGWTQGSDWAIHTLGASSAITVGSKYCAQYTGTAAQTIVNNQQIPCVQGNVLSASCLALWAATSGPASCELLINWYDVNGNAITPATAQTAAFINLWTQQLRVVGVAPSGASFAKVGISVGASTTSTIWYVAAFTAAILANSLAEVPNDPTGIYNKPVGITTGGQATTASIASGAVSSILSYVSTSEVSIGTTRVTVASCTQATDGGFVVVRINFVMNGAMLGTFILYKGDSSGEIMHTAAGLLCTSAGEVAVMFEAVDTSPAASQLYTVTGNAISGSGFIVGIIMTTTNLKV